MKTKYLFSSPTGDIILRPEDLTRPFLLSPTEKHPFLTLGHYFSLLEDFILQENGEFLNRILFKHFPEFPGLDKVEEIVIRSEKHGAQYHIARVDLLAGNTSCNLALTSAITGDNRRRLREEFERLVSLGQKFDFAYLPQVYGFGEEKCRTPAGAATFSLVVGEWFSGYHEWHLSIDKTDGKQKICLWDTATGNRFLTESEARQVIRQAAGILTLYYNIRTFAQIWPWHHAAGDFVLKSENGQSEVKLITARGYEPLAGFSADEGTGLEVPLLVFFLNLTLRIRLDRLDGTGIPAWFEDFAVHEAVSGFLEALAAKEMAVGVLPKDFKSDFLALLKTFDKKDFLEICQQIINHGRQDDHEEDLTMLTTRLPEHCQQLCRVLNSL